MFKLAGKTYKFFTAATLLMRANVNECGREEAKIVVAHALQNPASIHRKTPELVMPSYWSKKDERQYKHVKDSEEEQGRSSKRAREFAARTVNKHRSEEGRTAQSRSASGRSSRRSS